MNGHEFLEYNAFHEARNQEQLYVMLCCYFE